MKVLFHHCCQPPCYAFCVDVYGVFADGKEESLLGKKRDLSREVAKLKEKYEHLVSRFPNLRFDYK